MHGRSVLALASIVLACAASCTLALPAPSTGSDGADSIAGLERRIGDLKRQARFEDAAELAAQLLRKVEESASSRPYEVTDARWLLQTVETAAALSEDAQAELALMDSLQAVADLSWTDGRYAIGMAAAERRLEILRKYLGSEHPEVARSMDDVGGFLDEFGESARGESLSTEALRLRERLLGRNHPLLAENTNNLAHYASARGDYPEAAHLAGDAVEMYRNAFGSEHTDLATAIGNQALFLHLSGDLSAAEPLFRESIEMDRRLLGDDSPKPATTIDNLAVLFMDKGDYASAEPLYRESLALRRKALGEEHPYLALGLNNLGVLLHEQGDYYGAEEFLLESLAMRRKLLGDNHPSVARTLSSLSAVYSERGDYVEAERIAREALSMLTNSLGREHPQTALALSNLACALGDLEHYTEAASLFEEVLAIRRDAYGDSHPDVAAAIRNKASMLAFSGDREQALPLYRDALETFRRTLGEGHRDVVQSLQRYGEALLAEGEYEAAEASFSEAASVYDAARLRAGTGYTRSAFQRTPYESLAAARLLLGDEDDAWVALERALGRSLADLLMFAERRELSPGEAAREDSLKRALGGLERELSVYRAAARKDTTGQAEAHSEKALIQLLAAEAEWSAFQRAVAAAHPVTEGETFTLEDVQSSLSAETALVGWLDVDFPGVERNAWAYVVRSSGPVNWARLALIDGEESSSSGRLRGFRWGLADPQTPPSILDRDARALWRERIEPIEPFLEGVSELVVVPSGSVLGVPVEALISPDGAALGERFAVSYAPSATVHTWLRKRTATPTGREANRALLVGDPPFAEYQLDMVEEDYVGVESIAAQGDRISDSALARGVLSGNPGALSSLPRLAGTLSEVEGVAGLFPEAEVLLGESASEQELVELAQQGELKGFVVIHLATHALADDDHPDRSALILSQVGLPDPLEAALSGDRIHDGVVTATEIVRQWNLDAELVTLSACDTGLGKEVVGEGYIGLTQAFLQAGARSLLVSLWKVDDEATSLLMRRFYENWLAGADDGSGGSSSGRMSKAAALAEAKQWLRTRHDASGETPYDHPYYWSSFVLIGDPR